MLRLSEPGLTPYDLRFSVFGIPVRVSAWFWLAALILGQGYASDGIRFLLAATLALFLSILIHELGHTFAFRYFGISSHIVLYHFGGLAIPDQQAQPWSRTQRRDDPRSSLLISAAGPALQIVSALVLIFGLNLAGYAAPLPAAIARGLPAQIGEPIPSHELWVFTRSYCYVSIYWALLNLLPVMPLDGGHIARSLLQIFGDAATALPYSLMLSVAVGGLIAFWGFSNNDHFMAIMFGLLAFGSYQQLQMVQSGGGRRW